MRIDPLLITPADPNGSAAPCTSFSMSMAFSTSAGDAAPGSSYSGGGKQLRCQVTKTWNNNNNNNNVVMVNQHLPGGYHD